MNLTKIYLMVLKLGDNMEQCTNCGSSEFTEVIVVDSVPAKICKKCGDESFSRDTLAHIQSIIYGKPKKYIKAKSFEYA